MKLQIALGRINILTILSIPIHQQISFHVLMASFISFGNILQSVYKSFTSLVKNISKYFALSDASINGQCVDSKPRSRSLKLLLSHSWKATTTTQTYLMRPHGLANIQQSCQKHEQ